MAKSTLKKALALLLSVMLVLSALCGAAIGAYAETPDYAGTVTDGVTVNSSTFWSDSPAIDDIQNGDFENGLLWWGSTGRIKVDGSVVDTKCSDVAQLVTEENGNHYVAFNFGDSYTQYGSGLRTFKVSIPDTKISAGDNLVVLYDHKEDTDNNYQFRIDQLNTKTTNSFGVSVSGKFVFYKANGWERAHSNTTAKVAERKDTSADYTFTILVQATSETASTAAFDNIRLAKVVNGNLYDLDGKALYTFENKGNNDKMVTTEVATGKKYLGYTFNFQPCEGTYENGIYTTGSTQFNLPVYEGPINFNDGFKYWTTKLWQTGNPSDKFVLTEVDGETCMTYKDGLPQYSGIQSVKVHYPNLKTGDKVAFIFDQKRIGTSKVGEVVLYMVDSTGSTAKSTFNAATASNGFVPYVAGPIKLTSDDVSFYVQMQNTSVITSFETDNMFIKNMRMVKVNDDGTYTDLNDGMVYYRNNTVYGGTVSDGIVTTSEYFMTPYRPESYTTWFPANPDGFMNGDFSQGLRFWAKEGSAGKASDLGSVTDGVLTLTSPRAFASLRSQHFCINNVAVGDKIGVYFEACNTSNSGFVQVILATYCNGEAAESKVTLTAPTSDWKNAIASYTVTEDDISNGPLKASVLIQNSYEGTSQIKNLKLVKIDSSNTVESYTYIDSSDTEKYMLVDGEFYPYYGTADKGMYAGYSGNYYPDYFATLPDFMNGDFSEGLKYWMTKGGTKYLSDEGFFVNEDGQMVIGYTGDYSGIRSANFRLNGIKTGDVLYARADILPSPNFNLTLFEHNNSSNGHVAITSDTLTTVTTSGLTVSDASNCFYLQLQNGGNAENNVGAQTLVDNICLLRKDRGGLEKAPQVNLDGSLLDGSVYGDANNDGTVDLRDLVRAKSVAVGRSGAGIFMAAVDYVTTDDTIGADDVAEVAKYILDENYVYTK